MMKVNIVNMVNVIFLLLLIFAYKVSGLKKCRQAWFWYKNAVLVNVVNVIPLFPGGAYLKCRTQNKYDTPSKTPFWFTTFTGFVMVKTFTMFCLKMRH